MTGAVAIQTMLAGMPEPQDLRLGEVDGRVVITVGTRVVFDYATGDTGLRNVAVVTLTELGFTGRRVAEVLGLTEEYVSMLRGRARREGSAGLVRRRGRPPALGATELRKAQRWRAAGQGDVAIGRRLGVHATTVGRALSGLGEDGSAAGARSKQEVLPLTEPTDIEPTDIEPTDIEPTDIEPTGPAEPVGTGSVTATPATEPTTATEPAAQREPAGPVVELFGGAARIDVGVHRSRYAGAMLLHPYLHRVHTEAVFATLTGGPARRYDDLAVLTCATVGFALGIDTVEGAKHLRRAEAGPVVGLTAIPELATLRARLGALADGSDPLGLQRSFAAGMLAADPAADPVYFVDDHFVPYAGARPVAKGWNTKRRHAEPGRDDTLLVDARGRAVVFASSEPTGLSSTLPGVLAQLRQVLGPDAPILLAFDRGGAYPAAFRACRAAGAHWVTYRRAPLVAVTVAPERSATVWNGRRVSVLLADETITIKDYGAARQLTLFEHGAPVLQVLTSDLTAAGAELLCWLRARWRIENMFKYAAAHNGIDALADYAMDIGPDLRKVANPARAAARKAVNDAEAELAAAERALPQLLGGTGTPKEINAALPAAYRRIEQATTDLAGTKAALRGIPAKVPVTELNPDAKRARPHLPRRGLQMVLRLLAFNAEAWLAEHLNAYLADPDEYRAITRHLLHHGGQIDYTPERITVTLDRPDSPRIARALTLLTEELNTTPAHLPGDRRPLTYRIADA